MEGDLIMSIKKYNTRKIFTVDTSEFEEYKSLKELYEENDCEHEEVVFPLRGLYISSASQFVDEAPIAATDDYYVNLPSHLITTVKEILKDQQAIADINAQRVGFTIYKYHKKKYNRDCFSIDLCDR